MLWLLWLLSSSASSLLSGAILRCATCFRPLQHALHVTTMSGPRADSRLAVCRFARGAQQDKAAGDALQSTLAARLTRCAAATSGQHTSSCVLPTSCCECYMHACARSHLTSALVHSALTTRQQTRQHAATRSGKTRHTAEQSHSPQHPARHRQSKTHATQEHATKAHAKGPPHARRHATMKRGRESTCAHPRGRISRPHSPSTCCLTRDCKSSRRAAVRRSAACSAARASAAPCLACALLLAASSTASFRACCQGA